MIAARLLVRQAHRLDDIHRPSYADAVQAISGVLKHVDALVVVFRPTHVLEAHLYQGIHRGIARLSVSPAKGTDSTEANTADNAKDLMPKHFSAMERSILFILHFILLSARHKTWCKDRRKNNNRKGFYLFFLNTASFSKTRENPYIFIYKAVQKKKPDRTPRCNKKEIGKAAQRQAREAARSPLQSCGKPPGADRSARKRA